MPFVYFYSSETNVNNFKSLKIGFDRYLSAYGPYEFQPFADRETFEAQVKDKGRCLLILSSWHYQNIFREYGLRSILAGGRNGEKYQNRILVVKGEPVDINYLKTARIASASSMNHTRIVLDAMFGQKNITDNLRILKVPKDIDALMSVGFGMSAAALTTKNAFEELKNINSVLYGRLSVLVEGEASLMLVLAAPSDFVKQAEDMIAVFRKMPMTPEGKNNMGMLGLDNWVTLDPDDLKRLEAE